MGMPTIYPTGVTIYNKDKCSNGYNLVPLATGETLLFDMNGNEIRKWNLHGMPPKMLKGGNIIGYSGRRNPKYGSQDGLDLVQIDFDGNIVWKFDRYDYIDDFGENPRYMARSHHDFQREGNPVGYDIPNVYAKEKGNTIILSHKTICNNMISKYNLIDDIILEVDFEGNIIWEWSLSEHFDELGLDEYAKEAIFNNPSLITKDKPGDYGHMNSISYVGENRHFDNGDERFNPENLIFDLRELNIMGIIEKKTGKIVYKIGPDFINSYEKKLSQIIGQHHFHLIPKGLEGEGNFILFDNGGWAGYGKVDINSFDGTKNAKRDYSRILEFDPITLDIVWQLTPKELNHIIPIDAYKFYSPYISSVQRLKNGNTLVDEGSNGRVFEITKDYEIVWEWISPYFNENEKGILKNPIYRAYRYSYDYLPFLDKPNEISIEKIDIRNFRMNNAGKNTVETINIDGVIPLLPEVAIAIK